MCRYRGPTSDLVRRNMREVFPDLNDDQTDTLVQRFFQTQARDEMEASWFARPWSFLRRIVNIMGLETLSRDSDSKRGILLFSGHLGSTGLFFVTLGRKGYPIHIVGRSIEPDENPLHPAIFAYAQKRVRRLEQAAGNSLLLTGRGNYPVMKRKLRDGEVVMILIDVVPTLLKRTLPVRFLGFEALFGDGIASLYRETGARLVHWSIHYDGRRHNIELQDVTAEVDSLISSQQIMQYLASRIEAQIRKHPDHWTLWDSLAQFRRAEQPAGIRQL